MKGLMSNLVLPTLLTGSLWSSEFFQNASHIPQLTHLARVAWQIAHDVDVEYDFFKFSWVTQPEQMKMPFSFQLAPVQIPTSMKSAKLVVVQVTHILPTIPQYNGWGWGSFLGMPVALTWVPQVGGQPTHQLRN